MILAVLTGCKPNCIETKCNHPTIEQIRLKIAKEEIFVDSIYNAKKKDVPRLTDSLNKYKL